MSNEVPGPPDGQQWVWQTRALRSSDSWRSQSINCRRFIDFLLLEHMAKGLKANGLLMAPYEQLEAFGIGVRYIADAIREAEELGLADCFRGGLRIATTYALTWIPSHEGSPATNRWRAYRNPALKALKPENLPLKGKADPPQNLPLKGKVLLRVLTREG